MEESNLIAMRRILGEDAKVCRLLDFAKNPRDIADPWWTGNFDVTYDDIVEGCGALLEHIIKCDLWRTYCDVCIATYIRRTICDDIIRIDIFYTHAQAANDF